ncbi:hypothetical protein DFH08DRAFT_900642, partial [Mycena albidolilacea]
MIWFLAEAGSNMVMNLLLILASSCPQASLIFGFHKQVFIGPPLIYWPTFDFVANFCQFIPLLLKRSLRILTWWISTFSMLPTIL